MTEARGLYRRFRGAVARRVLRTGLKLGGRWITEPGKINIQVPDSLAVIGHVSAIEYDAVYGGLTKKARHVFAPGSRPLLAVGTRRGQVFLIGEKFIFTDRGFLDFDTHGSIEYNEKTRQIKRVRE